MKKKIAVKAEFKESIRKELSLMLDRSFVIYETNVPRIKEVLEQNNVPKTTFSAGWCLSIEDGKGKIVFFINYKGDNLEVDHAGVPLADMNMADNEKTVIADLLGHGIVEPVRTTHGYILLLK